MSETSVSISPRIQEELVHEAAQTSEAMTLLQSFQIHTPEDFAFAGGVLKTVKARWKELEEKRTSVTGPINQALRQINDWFRPVQKPLKDAEELLKARIGTYEITQAAAREEAMLAAASAAAEGDQAKALEHVSEIVPTAIVPGVAIKAVWAFEITNEAEVPREYLSVDPKKIQASIWYADTPHTPPRPIPGVRFFLEGQVRVRA